MLTFPRLLNRMVKRFAVLTDLNICHDMQFISKVNFWLQILLFDLHGEKGSYFLLLYLLVAVPLALRILKLICLINHFWTMCWNNIYGDDLQIHFHAIPDQVVDDLVYDFLFVKTGCCSKFLIMFDKLENWYAIFLPFFESRFKRKWFSMSLGHLSVNILCYCPMLNNWFVSWTLLYLLFLVLLLYCRRPMHENAQWLEKANIVEAIVWPCSCLRNLDADCCTT